jgi:hypothetical protein
MIEKTINCEDSRAGIPSNTNKTSKEEAFQLELERYTQLHNDIMQGRQKPRFIQVRHLTTELPNCQCILINGWGNVFQESLSCLLFAIVSRFEVYSKI